MLGAPMLRFPMHPRYARMVDRLLRHYVLWKLVTPPSSAAPAAPS